jgi:hypothetical protein
MHAPSGQLGQEAIFQHAQLVHGQCSGYSMRMKQMIEVQEQLTAMLGGGQVQAKTTVTPKAKTSACVALDEFKSAVTAAGQVPRRRRCSR